MMSTRQLLKTTALLALAPTTINARDHLRAAEDKHIESLHSRPAPFEYNVSVGTNFGLGEDAHESLSERVESTWMINFEILVASEQAQLSVQAGMINDAEDQSADLSRPTCAVWARLPAVSSQDDAASTCEDQLSSQCIAALRDMMSSGKFCDEDEDVKEWPYECEDFNSRPLNTFQVTAEEAARGKSVQHDYIRNLEMDDVEEEVLDDLAESVWLVALGWQYADAGDQEKQHGLVRCARLADDEQYFTERAQSQEHENEAELDAINEILGENLELRDLEKRKGGGGGSSGSKSSSKSSSSKSSSKSSDKSSGSSSDSSKSNSGKKSKNKSPKVIGGGGSGNKNKTEKDGAAALGQGGSMGFAAAGAAGFVILLGLL